MKKMLLALTMSVSLFYPTTANEQVKVEFLKSLNKTNYDELVKKIKDEKIQKVLETRFLKNFLAHYYHTSIYTIFLYESGNFTHNQGIYDKDDMGYCQVNRRYWSLEMINDNFKLKKRITSWYQFKNDINMQIEVCSLVWLYRIGVYLNNMKKRPPNNLVDYITLYHSFSNKPRIRYKKAVSDIFWKIHFSNYYLLTKN